MDDELPGRLALNVKQLRQARGMTQQKMAKLAGMPRATWANLESGAANPTLGVLYNVALALEVPLEELIATPRADVKLYKKGSLPSRTRSRVVVSSLLPEDLPNTQIERFDMPGHSRMIGVPHTPGTREYLTCETGEIELTAGGEDVSPRARRPGRVPRRPAALVLQSRAEDRSRLLGGAAQAGVSGIHSPAAGT